MDNSELNARYELVKKLIRLFRFERIVHLIITAVSLIVLLIAISSMIAKPGVKPGDLSLMFGSSGLVTYTGARLLRMWDQALKIIITGKL
jgi:hypothetical protein